MNEGPGKNAANSSFALVDLESQSIAVSEHVRGWKKDDILSWLAERGSVQVLNSVPGPETIYFESPQGFRSVFILDGDEFTFIADNTNVAAEVTQHKGPRLE
jgi:hypothetical protein